jgi:hypothetical protein
MDKRPMLQDAGIIASTYRQITWRDSSNWHVLQELETIGE